MMQFIFSALPSWSLSSSLCCWPIRLTWVLVLFLSTRVCCISSILSLSCVTESIEKDRRSSDNKIVLQLRSERDDTSFVKVEDLLMCLNKDRISLTGLELAYKNEADLVEQPKLWLCAAFHSAWSFIFEEELMFTCFPWYPSSHLPDAARLPWTQSFLRQSLLLLNPAWPANLSASFALDKKRKTHRKKVNINHEARTELSATQYTR